MIASLRGGYRTNFLTSPRIHSRRRQASTAPSPFRPSSPSSSQSSLLLAALLATAGGAGLYFYQASSSSSSKPYLSYGSFTPLKIKDVKRITADSSIFTLALPHSALPHSQDYPPSEPPDNPLQAIYIRQPELQLQRAYTPLEAQAFSTGETATRNSGDVKDAKKDREIRLLVKRYDDGEVSSYLHRLGIGGEVDIRGPVRTWTIPPDCEHLIFVRCSQRS